MRKKDIYVVKGNLCAETSSMRGKDIVWQALEASAAYGRVVGAGPNFGDCFAYACVKVLRVPLLYKGNDFAHTDLA